MPPPDETKSLPTDAHVAIGPRPIHEAEDPFARLDIDDGPHHRVWIEGVTHRDSLTSSLRFRATKPLPVLTTPPAGLRHQEKHNQ